MLNRVSLLIVVVALAATTFLAFYSQPQAEGQTQTPEVVVEAAAEPEAAAYEPAAPARTLVEFSTSPEVSAAAQAEPAVEQEEAIGWLYGNVLDIDSGEPIQGAKIFLDKGREGVVGFYGPFVHGTSRVDGSFRMEVPVGAWRASIKIPKPKQANGAYPGQVPGMVHGTVEIFADKETPFSFLIDTSTKLTGAIFMKDNPVRTTLRMEVIRVVDQEVVAILNLLGDHKWTEERAKEHKQPATPSHGAFQLDYLGQYLYEIRVSPFYADAPKDAPYWSLRADLTSGSVDLGKHGISYADFFGPGSIAVSEPALTHPQEDTNPAPEMVWDVVGTRVND
jgi:hypothetical protein